MIFKTLILLFLLTMMMVTSTSSSRAVMDGKQTYIIYMDKTKIRSSIHSQDITKPWYKSVLDSISQEASSSLSEQDRQSSSNNPDLLYVYETTMFGFSAHLSQTHLKSLNQIEGFLRAIPDELVHLHTTYTPHFLGLSSGTGLWSKSNLGSDVIIGVLDSGIWPEHVSFRESAGMLPVPSRWKGVCENGTQFSSGNCNKKLIGARAFFKGYEKFAGKINESTDYRSARDSEGHGTHTASTAAGGLVENASLFGLAGGTAAGMRYSSRIAAYKVCWSLGCTSSDIIAAADVAVADGVDVLSLSLGGAARPYYSDSIAIASFGAIQKGVFVSCSAGNSGPSKSSVGNVAPWILTVGASYTDRSFQTKVKLGNGQVFKGSSLYKGKPTKQMLLVYGKSAANNGSERLAQYCAMGSLNPELVNGKMVACDRGINGRTRKGEVVKMAGGLGMILLNSASQGEELFADAHIIPATSLGASASQTIRSYVLSDKKPTASISFIGTVYGDSDAPTMAAFSSRGPSLVGPDVIKPDLTAPGVNILAAWPPKTSPSLLKSDKRSVLFNIISGTSMSCPHASGIAALVKSVHRDWSPAAIKSALMTTAYTLNHKGLPIGDIGSNRSSEMANPFALGSGHVDPEKASNPGLVYDITTQDYLNYLCSLNYTSSQIALLLGSKRACSIDGSLQPGDLNYPSFAVLLRSRNTKNARVTYKRLVTNVGYPKSNYVVKVEEPMGISVTVEPKNLNFAKVGEKLSYNVTFVADGRARVSGSSSFGSLVWISGNYIVRSPIAVTWE
ncbi:subtilisin-like protease SBT1.1 [Prosopis cineraria]|uniref:subtilisin-like protease SBT1.1 n=1 Tax=Prosopis cineraria TaxID=364024 RepID=UPI00240F5540|nr:subtilisin-like protease SBT1.1 [Prosopis cineraria]